MTRYIPALLIALAVNPLGTVLPVTMRDIDGKAWTLLAPGARQIDLLFFVARDCPISNRYAPEISRICADYLPRGVRCFVTYTEPDGDVTAVAKHRLEFGYGPTVPVFIDRDHTLVKAAGATVTPQAVIYSSAGRVYSGRIDDLYVDVGRSRRQATRHDVRLALNAALDGKPATPAETEAIGCFIPAR